MNVIQQYSNEVSMEILKNQDQIKDMLQFLLLYAEDSDNNQQAVLQMLNSIKAETEDIKKDTTEIKSDIGTILEMLTRLESEFVDVKNEKREIEEKITLMTIKLSKLEGSVHGEALEDYYALAQSLYVNWEDFDQLTRRFIPLAEFLYSQLQKFDNPDYSPVILELCRAIENEFLLKIFKRYTMDLVTRKGRVLDEFLNIDRSTEKLINKTGQFVKAVSKAAKSKKPEYTLGQMNTILSFMGDDSLVRRSPLLSDFKDYLLKNTEAKKLLDLRYIKKVNEIVSNYRNPSAHPEFMSIEKANECRKIMPDRLDYLMECITA